MTRFKDFLLEEYDAFVLDKKSRALLRDTFPPKYPEFVGQHITIDFGVKKDKPMPHNAKTVEVVGYSEDDGIEALVVKVNGKLNRPDGKVYHITWSLDRLKGKKPVHSNNAIARGWTPIDQPIPISVSVERLK